MRRYWGSNVPTFLKVRNKTIVLLFFRELLTACSRTLFFIKSVWTLIKQGQLISVQWLTSSVFCLAKAWTSGTFGMRKGKVGLRGNGLERQEAKRRRGVAESVRWSGWQGKMDRWMNEWSGQVRYVRLSAFGKNYIQSQPADIRQDVLWRFYLRNFRGRAKERKTTFFLGALLFFKECSWSADQSSLRLVREEGSG